MDSVEKNNTEEIQSVNAPIIFNSDKFEKLSCSKNITVLNLSRSSLTELPADIVVLINLKFLDLSTNKLTHLPKTFISLGQLISLNLSHNEFAKVPKIFFFGLRKLRVLDFSFNKISEFRDPPLCLSNISDFKMSNNGLTEIPFWLFSNLCHLNALELNCNPISLNIQQLESFQNLGADDSLYILKLNNCALTPEKLKFQVRLNSLKVLDLGNLNEYEKFLNYFGNSNLAFFKHCPNLKCLSIENVQISLLPLNFGEWFKCLSHLNLCNNALSWLPESISNLTCLKVLNLNSNQLIFLPNNIGELKNLEQFHLANNNLSALPKSFLTLNMLKFIDLYNNYLELFDFSILKLKNLKGADFEQNYIDIYQIKTQDNLSDGAKYKKLIKFFRKKFKLNEARLYGAKIKCDEYSSYLDAQFFSKNEESDQRDEFESIEYDSDSHFTGFNEVCSSFDYAMKTNKQCDVDAQIEDWDNKSINIGKNDVDNNKDDMFDPESVVSSGSSTCIGSSWTYLRNNYCPGRSHVQSFLMKLKKEKMKFYDFEEGQFDPE